MSFDYTLLSSARPDLHTKEGWQAAFEKSLRATSPKDRRPNFRFFPRDSVPIPDDEKLSLVFLVSPATRLQLAPWKQYGFVAVLQHPDVPDDEVRCCHIQSMVLDTLVRDPDSQPISERWYRAWVIAGKPGAYGMDEVIQVFGHLHGAETAA